MDTARTQAFSDGVIAIIITVMVLELAAPTGSHWRDLAQLWPKLVVYLASFGYVGIYWNNHHQVFQIAERANTAVLWTNLAVLFCLSLLPLATAWVGDTRFAPAPVSFYALVTLVNAVSMMVLVRVLHRADPGNARLAAVAGTRRRTGFSLPGYALCAVLPAAGQWGAWVASALLALLALGWVVPVQGRHIPALD